MSRKRSVNYQFSEFKIWFSHKIWLIFTAFCVNNLEYEIINRTFLSQWWKNFMQMYIMMGMDEFVFDQTKVDHRWHVSLNRINRVCAAIFWRDWGIAQSIRFVGQMAGAAVDKAKELLRYIREKDTEYGEKSRKYGGTDQVWLHWRWHCSEVGKVLGLRYITNTIRCFSRGNCPKKFHGGPSTSKDKTGLHHTESTQGDGAVMADEEEREEAFILSQS